MKMCLCIDDAIPLICPFNDKQWKEFGAFSCGKYTYFYYVYI